MRLVPCLLIVAPALVAQDAPVLAELAWTAVSPREASAAPAPSTGPLTVRLAADGTLHIFGTKGVRKLRTGLPGRPTGVWRDGGVPVPEFVQPLAFPDDTPLRRGVGGMPLGQADFRPALQGLLWILDDGERCLTVVHPATAQVVRVRLPELEGPSLRFHPDGLEVVASGQRRAAWGVPWAALLPQFLQLGRPAPAPAPGTAMDPFPKL